MHQTMKHQSDDVNDNDEQVFFFAFTRLTAACHLTVALGVLQVLEIDAIFYCFDVVLLLLLLVLLCRMDVAVEATEAKGVLNCEATNERPNRRAQQCQGYYKTAMAMLLSRRCYCWRSDGRSVGWLGATLCFSRSCCLVVARSSVRSCCILVWYGIETMQRCDVTVAVYDVSAGILSV